MEQLIFPVTKKAAEKQGGVYSSETNKNALFPSRLRELRKEKGVSQDQLSKELGVSKSTIGLYETGDTLPDAKTLRDLAVYFEVSADWLLGITETRNQDISIRQICEKIGLEEQVVVKLQKIYQEGVPMQESIEGINDILSSPMLPLLAQDYIRLKRFTKKVITEYKKHSFNELEDPIYEEGETVTLKGYSACEYYRAKIIDQFSTLLNIDIPVYETTAAYLSSLEERLEKI